MQFIHETKIDFIGLRKYGYLLTAICLLISFIHMGFVKQQTGHWLRWGIDFSGGILIDFKFGKPVQEELIRSALNSMNLEELTIQRVGEMPNEFRIRTREKVQTAEAKIHIADQIVAQLRQQFPQNSVTILSQESVGASVAGDFIKNAVIATILAWICIIIYLFYRFEFKFAAAGVFALIHDTLITLGALSIMNKEITLIVFAAILTNIGYSIHDTIIIYDRIRENRKIQRRMDFADIINLSTNQTLSRTTLTVLTVLMVELTLFFRGGLVIHDFVFTLLVGLITGTFSSIYVASPIILEWMRWEKRRGIKVKA